MNYLSRAALAALAGVAVTAGSGVRMLANAAAPAAPSTRAAVAPVGASALTPVPAAIDRDGGAARPDRASPFRVICHFPCGPLADQALAVAEAALPFAALVYGPIVTGRPLEIHLYRTAAEYRAARSGLLRRAPGPLAVTEPATRSAHIALRATIADTTLRRVGLPPNILRVIAHEAFHLAAVGVDPALARLPAWLNEGAASWAEYEVMRAMGGDADIEPVAATYAWLLRERAASGALPSLQAILDDDLDLLDEQERYAIRKLLFEHVAKWRDVLPLPEVLAAAISTGTRGDRAARRLHARLFADPARTAAVEDALHESALAGRPAWAQSARSLDMLSAAEWLQIGLAGDARAWRIRFATSVQLAGVVEPLTPGIAYILIGTAEPGNLEIEIDTHAGEVRVRREGGGEGGEAGIGRAGSEAGTGRAGSEAVLATMPLTVRGGPIAFEVDARPGSVVVRAGGRELVARSDDATPNGMWGVGASEGTNLLWRDVALRR